MRVFWILTLTLVLGACSSGETDRSCRDYSDCPTGQYCGPDNMCTQDCKDDSDCPGGTCNSIGKCAPHKPDGGPGPEVGPDGTTPEGGAPDVLPLDLQPTNEQPVPDVWPQPDVVLAPDMPPDLAVADAPPAPDANPVDGPTIPDGLPALPCATVMGTPCTNQGYECGSLATCLLTGEGGVKGVCTCSCAPDDPSTPLINEDSCPLVNSRCGKVALTGGTTANFCFKTCSPKLGSNDCQGGLSCDPRSGAAIGLYDVAVCMFYGCTTGADCPVTTSTTCTTTSPTSCATGETCLALTGGSTDGYCAKAGQCDLPSGLCNVHTLGQATAKVGDPCKDDTECAGNMHCLMQIDWSTYRKKGGQSCTDNSDCCSGTCQLGTCTSGLCTVDHRNGYCTISGCAFSSTLTIRACPTGSDCNHLYSSGLCQKSCSLATASDCRGNTADLLGDYECRAWNNLSLGYVQITQNPVCDFGPAIACDVFGSSSTLSCASLGEQSNPTNMTCRGLDNSIKANAKDPNGFCLDNTASGTQIRNPLPTP